MILKYKQNEINKLLLETLLGVPSDIEDECIEIYERAKKEFIDSSDKLKFSYEEQVEISYFDLFQELNLKINSPRIFWYFFDKIEFSEAKITDYFGRAIQPLEQILNKYPFNSSKGHKNYTYNRFVNKDMLFISSILDHLRKILYEKNKNQIINLMQEEKIRFLVKFSAYGLNTSAQSSLEGVQFHPDYFFNEKEFRTTLIHELSHQIQERINIVFKSFDLPRFLINRFQLFFKKSYSEMIYEILKMKVENEDVEKLKKLSEVVYSEEVFFDFNSHINLLNLSTEQLLSRIDDREIFGDSYDIVEVAKNYFQKENLLKKLFDLCLDKKSKPKTKLDKFYELISELVDSATEEIRNVFFIYEKVYKIYNKFIDKRSEKNISFETLYGSTSEHIPRVHYLSKEHPDKNLRNLLPDVDYNQEFKRIYDVDSERNIESIKRDFYKFWGDSNNFYGLFQDLFSLTELSDEHIQEIYNEWLQDDQISKTRLSLYFSTLKINYKLDKAKLQRFVDNNFREDERVQVLNFLNEMLPETRLPVKYELIKIAANIQNMLNRNVLYLFFEGEDVFGHESSDIEYHQVLDTQLRRIIGKYLQNKTHTREYVDDLLKKILNRTLPEVSNDNFFIFNFKNRNRAFINNIRRLYRKLISDPKLATLYNFSIE